MKEIGKNLKKNNYDLGKDKNMCRFLTCQYWDFEKEKCLYNYCKKIIVDGSLIMDKDI